MMRRLRRWINIRLTRWGLPPLLLLAACSKCQPLPEPVDPEPTTTTGTSTTGGEPSLAEKCATVCLSYEERGCSEATPVCYEFDDAGECAEMLTCKKACENDPAYYLTGECEQ